MLYRLFSGNDTGGQESGKQGKCRFIVTEQKLRMPLDAQDKGLFWHILGFDKAVRRYRTYFEARRTFPDCLMMETVYRKGTESGNLGQQAIRSDRYRMYRLLTGGYLAVLDLRICHQSDILINISSKSDIDGLKSPAYTEHRLSSTDKFRYQLKFQKVSLPADWSAGNESFLLEVKGADIRAARH